MDLRIVLIALALLPMAQALAAPPLVEHTPTAQHATTPQYASTTLHALTTQHAPSAEHIDPLRAIFPEDRYATLGLSNGPAPKWVPASDDPYGVAFHCDTGIGGAGQAVVDSTACPILIADLHDALSQPVLLVDPRNEEYQAFSAMHGGRGLHSPLAPQPPSDASRHNELHQPHTMFRSGGSGWEDWPYYAPDQVAASGRTIFGEDNAATLDAKGNVYLGGILAMYDTEDADYRYTVVVYKEGRINRQPGYLEPVFFPAETDFGIMSQLHMTYVPKTDEILVMWNERAKELPNAEPGRFETRVIHSQPSGASQWQELSISERFGPCQGISGPALYAHLAYVACLPAAGYGFDFNITPDRVQVHSIDTISWTTQHTSQTALKAGHLTMVDRGEGHQILMSSGVDASGRAFALVSYGVLGDRWSNPDDYGAELHGTSEAPGAPLADARITAAAHNGQTSTIHVIWFERYDLDNTNPTQVGAPSMHKTYAVLRPGGGFLGNMDLGYGRTATGPAVNPLYQGGTGNQIFRDAHDSIVVWKDGRLGSDRIFVAFGDHGFTRWAEVEEINPPPIIPLPPAAIPAIPLAASSGSTSAASAALGAFLLLMLLRLLAARKKTRVEAPA